jgi:phosphoribosylformylglycinamidine synthase
MYHFYKQKGDIELCFNVDVISELTAEEKNKLQEIFADNFIAENISEESNFADDEIVEVGPRINVETPFSTNAVAICHNAGLDKIRRIELSKRYKNKEDAKPDRMTEEIYEKPLESFETGIQSEKVFVVPLIEEGIDALKKINEEMGLGMDD